MPEFGNSYKPEDRIVKFWNMRDSLMVSALACHAADPGSDPAQGDDFFN